MIMMSGVFVGILPKFHGYTERKRTTKMKVWLDDIRPPPNGWRSRRMDE